ncbi:hypothetical protein LCI18_013863 [Fusarium solani-melongenae]|uniref:Uncharacterized protein n=1 Tax=Fusarium solani subsp. cucurbitae TaxID=2747967 RepID=A0ACD3ZPC6_FUSSC|nr:hypothetical protein LCI18_013863 [Fusarium solani-melongenae]
MISNARSKRHQSVPACSRCYRLKQKCDRGTPRCRRCIAAGAECMAVNRQTAAEIPRSLLQHLEQQLEELQRTKTLTDVASVGADGNRSRGHLDQSHARTLEMATLSITAHMTPDLFDLDVKIQHRAKLFYPSERPPLKIPVRGFYFHDQTRSAGRAYASQFSHFKATKIPLHVARRLFKNYKDEILPRFPCFMEEDLDNYFESFYSHCTLGQQQTTMPSFIVPMILAISSLTSNSHDFPKVAALSESLHADALENAQLLKTSSVASLQCLVLLIQLGLLLPHTANCWFITGEAMRMAVSLGLHQEPDPAIIPDSAHAELRRRIFWTIYQLDRIVGIAAGCPVALSDAHIGVHLPYNGGDPHTTPEWFGLQRSHDFREAQFLIHTRIRIIQSQIHGVQFFDQPFPNHFEDYDAWVQSMMDLIKSLVNQGATDGLARSRLESAAYQCEVLLHRPCSRNMAVSASSLIAAATASIQLIMSHIQAVRSGGFIMAFELTNSAFQAGMVLLYVVRNHAAELEGTPILVSGHEGLDALIQLLDTLSIRWPAVADTAHYIRELVDTCRRNQVGQDGSDYDMSVLEELDCLVTQRRVHTIRHRNIPFPPHAKPGPQSDTASQTSCGFLDDDDWWRAFINDDLEMDESPPTRPEALVDFALPEARVTPPEPQSPNTSASTPVADLDKILGALPSCSFCRDRRIKCHQQLPACRECLRVSRECMIFDPVQGMNVSMRRIGFLVDKIKQLSKEALSESHSENPKQTLPDPTVVVHLTKGSPSAVLSKHTSSLFFGRWSSLGCLRSFLRQKEAYVLPKDVHRANCLSPYLVQGSSSLPAATPPMSMAISLFQLFARSANVFYPVLQPAKLDEILAQCYANDDGCLQSDTRQFFFLVLAVSSRIGQVGQANPSSQAEGYFRSAVSEMSTTCNHASRAENVALLQRTLLICLYLLLSPGSGDVWRHLGFAIRHFFDLAHRPSMEEDEFHDILCTLTRTLYCLESQLSIAFGRPSLLNIGDALRQELANRITNNLEEQISIFSYLISLQMLQIHSALLQHNSQSVKGATSICRSPAEEAREYCRGLDEWLVRWKEFVETVPDNDDDGVSRSELSAWGQFHYQLAVFRVSLLWPTPGGRTTMLCRAVADTGLELFQHQRLFARLYSGGHNGRPPPLVFPLSWTMGHAVLGLGLSAISGDLTYGDEAERASSLGRCSVLLAVLEVDPDYLLAGLSPIFVNLRE